MMVKKVTRQKKTRYQRFSNGMAEDVRSFYLVALMAGNLGFLCQKGLKEFF